MSATPSSTSRLLGALLTLLGVSFIVFMLLRWVPGDPLDAMLGEYAAAADRAGLAADLGLDRPWAEQWLRFLTAAVHLDLGRAIVGGQPVSALVAVHFVRTAELAVAALLIAAAAGLPLGVLAALRTRSYWATVVAALAVVGMSLPSFVLGPLLLVVFGVWLRWLPLGGDDDIASLVLPALTLAIPFAALLARMTQATLVEVLGQLFVRAARARGLREWTVVVGHGCRVAALPIVSVAGLQLGALLGGAVVTETVFGWPGLGQLVIDGIQRRDYPVVQGGVLTISVVYVTVNTLTDLLARGLDPRTARGA